MFHEDAAPAADPFIEQHLAHVETALLRGYSLTRVAEWICENTFLRGEPYSYEDHEFQEVIARDMALEVVVRKCSQIGLSELSVRIALAFCNTMPGFTTIYTLPTAGFAKKFAKTRIDPVIEGSSVLKRRVNPEMNSAELKQFLDSFLYINGTIGMKAAISVPADARIHDEVDFSDEGVMSSYESRMTHSKFKLVRKFSTPTVNGMGISSEFDTSRKHWLFVRCSHCNHQFLPDYFKHVRVPGFEDGDLRKINADNLWKFRWREAYLECPSCKKEPDLSPKSREWVVENTDYTGDKNGYQVQPFDAPKIITPADLVKASTKYVRYADFVNFNLGQPCEDLETSFSEEELKVIFNERKADEAFEPYAYVLGIDVGLVCHLLIGGLGPEGKMDIVWAERIEHTKLEARKLELQRMFRGRLTVMDSQPYFDLLLRMQAQDQNMWGAVYAQKKDLELMRVIEDEKDEETGQERRRQVDLNRNRAFDALMAMVRSGAVNFRGEACQMQKELIIRHMKDMKRVKVFDSNDELKFVWKKSSGGQDHYHHALLYAMVARNLIGTVQSAIIMPFGLTTIKVKDQVDARGKSLGRSL